MMNARHTPKEIPTKQLTADDSNAKPIADLLVWQAYDGEWYVDAFPPDTGSEPLPNDHTGY
jgi:hypothetical protein